MSKRHSLAAVAGEFQIDGDFSGATPHGSGHINDTYLIVLLRGGHSERVILQRINTGIFTRAVELMENMERVTAHIAAKGSGQTGREQLDSARRVLTLIPVRAGGYLHVDAGGNHWRAFRYIAKTRSFDSVESPEQAFQAARAFGEFQRQLIDLPGPRLHDTIPDFHHTVKRFAALQQAIVSDAVNRAITARPEIDFALAHQPMASVLLEANLPERVTHNDAKLNNVLLDDATGEGICVIDLDTVMPGLAVHDFGDMVRTTTSPAQEDERDLARVTMQIPMFEALVHGYLGAAGGFLTKAEKELLAFSGKLITFEIGIRFLADYLAGDRYYKVHRPAHNLDRCRTQFKLVQSIEQQEEAMDRLVRLIDERDSP